MYKKLYESFLYLWYDGRSKMFYLGKHLGIPEDSYTHSSSIWESFKKDNIPERVHRRILAYGTDEEICILENKCLENRKSKGEHCWKRYYNIGVGDPDGGYGFMSGENNPSRQRDMSGENAPGYKDGRCKDWKKYMKKYSKGYLNIPENKDKAKAYGKEYKQTPKYKAYWKEYMKRYNQRPEVKARKAEINQTPERKAYMKEYQKKYTQTKHQTPERKAYTKEYRQRKRYPILDICSGAIL